MKIITKIALLGALVITASSCKLDLLPTSAIESEQAFSTYADATKVSNGMNSRFRQTIYGQYAFVSEVQTDMFNASLDFGNRNGQTHRMGDGFTSSDYNIRDLWRQMYLSILSSNNFLAGIDKITPADATETKGIEQMKANAYFYRAFYYHKLIRYYSAPYSGDAITLGVPLILEYNINEKPGRATQAAIYEQILKDLDAAEGFLPAGKKLAETPTIDAVYALKARVYLFMKNYAKAAEYADKVITSAAGYSLCTTEAQMTEEWTNDNGTEDIMQLYANLTEFGSSYSGSGSGSARLAMDIYLGFKSANSKYTPDFIPTKTALDMYEATDLRRRSWFKELPCFFNAGDVNIILMNKYPGNPKLYQTVTNYAQKPKVFRVAEMHLIAAEAYLQTNVGLALARLNTLQSARGAANTPATEATVRAEWAKEMIGEGYRLDCLKRWGLGFKGRVPQNTDVTQQGTGFNNIDILASDYHFVWAIPDNEIQTNANIEKQQNPGW